MKKKYIVLTLLLFFQAASFAQSNRKIVVMITRANWCPTCRANDSKVKNELIPSFADSKDVVIVINDITNGRTKSKSKTTLQTEGVYEIAKEEKVTGSIAIINPAEGQIVGRVYLVNSVEAIKNAIKEAVSKKN